MPENKKGSSSPFREHLIDVAWSVAVCIFALIVADILGNQGNFISKF